MTKEEETQVLGGKQTEFCFRAFDLNGKGTGRGSGAPLVCEWGGDKVKTQGVSAVVLHGLLGRRRDLSWGENFL